MTLRLVRAALLRGARHVGVSLSGLRVDPETVLALVVRRAGLAPK